MNREVFYGSPVATGLDTDGTATCEIVFNERANADLSRLIGFASADAIDVTLGYSGFDFIENVDVTDLEVYGSDLLIVGRNTPTASLPLAADRFVGCVKSHSFNLARLGRLPFASSDTISLTMGIQGTNIQGSCGIAVPGTSNLVSEDYSPTRPPQILGEGGGGQIAAGASADLVLTADRAGWVPLSSLTISALQDAVATGVIGSPAPASALGELHITQIELPGSDQLVRGTGVATVPAAAFAANRQGNCIELGGLHMSAGSAITISVTVHGPNALNVRAAVPFFATDVKGRC